MKQSKTTLKELTAAYRAVLRHGILCNAIALGLIAATPAVGATHNYIPDAGNWGTQEIKNEIAADTWDSSVIFINKAGVIIGENSVFEGNKSGLGGAISIAKQIGEVSIGDGTVFKNNTSIYDGGAIGNYGSAILGSDISFINNRSNIAVDGSQVMSDSQPIGGGAISLGVNGILSIYNSAFIGNETGYNGGAIATRRTLQASEATESGFANLGNLLEIGRGTIFDSNKAWGYTIDTANGSKVGGNGGAIANTFATADITGATFTNNIAQTNGGAIYNTTFINADATGTDSGKGGVMTITDSGFSGNSAGGEGGAIYNTGDLTIAAMNSDVNFHGNTANGAANDIYNAGHLTLHASEDRTMSLAGGISGLNGTLDVVGRGTVEISNSLNNQTVTVGSGQLHLTSPMDLTGTMITVATGAKLNTVDNAINDYSAHTMLGNYSEILVDVSADGIDKFNILFGNTISVDGFTLLSDLETVDTVRKLSEYGNITDNPTFKAYTTNSIYTLTGNNANDGTVTIHKGGTGGLINAIGDTTDENHEGMYYSLTGNDTSVTSNVALRNADVDVHGVGTGDGDYGITLGANIGVGDNSSFVTHNVKIDGNANIENSEGAQIGFNSSKIDVGITNDGIIGVFDTTLVAGNMFENRATATTVVFNSTVDANVWNFGRWISDPSTYTGEFENEGYASFDADTFTSTAVLNNVGTVDLTNGVTFENGAEIASDGIINLASGTTHFNNTASSNTINLLNGADFDGVLTGTGILNMSNGTIDTVTGGVAGGGLIVDANLKGAGTIDTLTGGTTGAKIKTINVLNSEYGTAGSLSLNIGGATLDDDLQINGMNYYTNVAVDGENLVLSDKLMNTSGLHAQLGSWNGTIIGTSSTYDAETNSYTSTGTTVGEALTALETAVNGKVGASDIYTATITDTAVDNSNSKVVSVTAFQNSIANLKNSANTWAGVQGFTNGITIGSDYGITGAGVATLGATSVSSLTMGGQTVSGIDTSVAQGSSNLVTSGAVYSAVTTAVGHASDSEHGVDASGVYVAIEANTAAITSNTEAIETLTGTGSNSVSGQIASNAENATYTAGGTHADGTIGAALDSLNITVAEHTNAINDISTALGHASDGNNAATGLFATVEENSATIAALTGNGSGSISGQIASNAENATYTADADHASGTIGAAISQNASDIAAIDGKIGDMTEFDGNNYATDTASVSANLVALDGQLKTTSDKVDKLNADENTDGSVRNIAKSYFDLMAQDSALTLSEANAYTDKRIEKLDQDLSAGIASAVALSSVAVSDVRRGELSVGAGYGYFNGQSAGAFGAAMGISNRWSVNAGAGISGYDVSFRAGTNYKFKVF